MSERNNNDTPFGFGSREWLEDELDGSNLEPAGRDPQRIDVVLALLENYWYKNPDLRLAQIVVNAYQDSRGPGQVGLQSNSDPFYMEDDTLVSYLKERNRSVVVRCPSCGNVFATHEEHGEIGSYCTCGHGFHGGVIDD